MFNRGIAASLAAMFATLGTAQGGKQQSPGNLPLPRKDQSWHGSRTRHGRDPRSRNEKLETYYIEEQTKRAMMTNWQSTQWSRAGFKAKDMDKFLAMQRPDRGLIT